MRYVVIEFMQEGARKELPLLFPDAMGKEVAQKIVDAALTTEGSRLVSAGKAVFFERHVSCEGFDEQFNLGSRGMRDEVILRSIDYL